MGPNLGGPDEAGVGLSTPSLGITHYGSIFREVGEAKDFQLPLSGSQRFQVLSEFSSPLALSTPSLGITFKELNPDDTATILSTPSLGITDGYRVVLCPMCAPHFQLPLSGSHGG